MKYVREHLKSIAGYVPGEQPEGSGYIKLNTNENPYPPSPKVADALRNFEASRIKLYPDPVCSGVRKAAGEVYGFGENEIFVGNGSDEILSLIIRTFLEEGEAAVITYPTYILSKTLIEINNSKVEMVELDDDYMLPSSIYDAKGKLMFIANPNSPTGTFFPKSDIESICKNFDGIVVIDEAYVDFADDDCLEYAKKYENVIVTRTLSKSFSLAGARIGLAFANSAIVEDLLKVKDSYNAGVLPQVMAVAALSDVEHMRRNAEKIVSTRKTLENDLQNLGFRVIPSSSNFVFAIIDGAKEIYERLLERKILVRYFDAPRLRNGLRITIGKKAEISALLDAIREILS